MLTVADAGAAIQAALPTWSAESVPLAAACGRVLRQDVLAERDQPPFDRVTMDGIALRHAAFAAGRREFTIAGTQHAGDPSLTLSSDDGCIEVMTGAVLPVDSDCIIPVERTVRTGNSIQVATDYAASAHQFLHARGSDHSSGYRMLSPGRRLSAIDIALLASAGLSEVHVSSVPRLRVISTGNELVEPGAAIAAHQIRLSNGPAIVAMLQQQGFVNSRHLHLRDDPHLLEDRIGEQLANSDVLVLSGGVSMGQADFVPQVLDTLGVRKVFHKISQRPGKPMWFGTGPDNQLVFALPGNPVSALTCCRHYVLPALLLAAAAVPRKAIAVRLAESYRFSPPLTCFLPAVLIGDAYGQLLAQPVTTNTSGDFTALANTDGYLQLSADESDFAAGSAQPFFYWSQV
ncbi:MAG: molybdopterin molybdotransferase MoeA [Halioglobus sp.]|nr:molybdopterin molybdotransferase MoeA [Halioglobus sp.]